MNLFLFLLFFIIFIYFISIYYNGKCFDDVGSFSDNYNTFVFCNEIFQTVKRKSNGQKHFNRCVYFNLYDFIWSWIANSHQ